MITKDVIIMLNTDIQYLIFHLLPISDKRSFVRINKLANKLSIHMPQVEIDFQKMMNDANFFHNGMGDLFFYPLYKFTLELLYDGYDVPDKYIIMENKSLYQFPRIYKYLAKQDNFTIIQKLLRINPTGFNTNSNTECVMIGAAMTGNIKILEWMFQNYCGYYFSVTVSAIKAGQFDALLWLVKHNFPISNKATYYAAGYARMDILQFLVVHMRMHVDPCLAIRNGHFDIVKYIYSVYPDNMRVCGIIDEAICSGNLDLVKFIYEKNEGTFSDAAFIKHLHILEWLYENNHFLSKSHISLNVARGGNMECLQFLYRHNLLILNEKVFYAAALGRNIQMIIFLRNLGCPMNEYVIHGTFSTTKYIKSWSCFILKLLLEWGCSADGYCAAAAYLGELDLLQTLCAYGSKLHSGVIDNAARSGHLHIIIWCKSQGCEWDIRACINAAENCHLDVLKWLRGFDRNKYKIKSEETEICPWSELVCCYAIKQGYIEMLKFAIDNGCEFGEYSRNALANQNNPAILDCVKHII
uniref:Ankyrin repeat protein n=1 Tax=viral metagenome TaxID=1070528 RepID=A0A6C0C9E5_9ZZZZ